MCMRSRYDSYQIRGLFFLRRTVHIDFRTNTPNPIPRNVAIAIPKMPARIPGTMSEVQPLAVAIPHAVVGPPTLALEAISSSFRSNPNSLPTPRITARWTAIWTKANAKMPGVVFITFEMLPFAPTTAKNICFNVYKPRIKKVSNLDILL